MLKSFIAALIINSIYFTPVSASIEAYSLTTHFPITEASAQSKNQRDWHKFTITLLFDTETEYKFHPPKGPVYGQAHYGAVPQKNLFNFMAQETGIVSIKVRIASPDGDDLTRFIATPGNLLDQMKLEFFHANAFLEDTELAPTDVEDLWKLQNVKFHLSLFPEIKILLNGVWVSLRARIGLNLTAKPGNNKDTVKINEVKIREKDLSESEHSAQLNVDVYLLKDLRSQNHWERIYIPTTGKYQTCNLLLKEVSSRSPDKR